MSLIILQVIPSLIGYIIIVQTFNCATRSFPKHNFRWWAKLTSIFLVILVRLEQQAWFQVCAVPLVPLTYRFHHSSDSMSSPIDYIFMKSLNKCVMIIINILRSSRISIEFLMRNTILAPRWLVLSSTTSLPSLRHKLDLVMELLAVQLMLCSTLDYYHLLYQGCCEKCSTS